MLGISIITRGLQVLSWDAEQTKSKIPFLQRREWKCNWQNTMFQTGAG